MNKNESINPKGGKAALAILKGSGLYKRIRRPYLAICLGIAASLSSVLQSGDPIGSIKKISHQGKRSSRGLGHNATITEQVPPREEVFELGQVFGGREFDQIGSADTLREKEVINQIKQALDKITETVIEHHMGGFLGVVGQIAGEGSTMTSHSSRPSISIDKITGLASNDDETGLNTDNPKNIGLAEKRAENIRNIISKGIEEIMRDSLYNLNIESIDVDGESVKYIEEEIQKIKDIAGGKTEQEIQENVRHLMESYNNGSLTGEGKSMLDQIVGSKRNVKIKVSIRGEEKIEIFTFDYGFTIPLCLILRFFPYFLPRSNKNESNILRIVNRLEEGKEKDEIVMLLKLGSK